MAAAWPATTSTATASIAGSTNATTTTFSDNTQPTSVTVSYFVRARDGAGNLSGNSNTVTRQGTTNETNVALNKAVTATGSTFTFVPANATDGNVATYWEGSPTYPQDITVALGANHAISRVVVKLNPDPAWGTRTQNFQILGRDQASSTYTNLVSAANYQFVQGNNVVTVPVTASTADVRLRFNSNTGAPSGQVAELEVWGVAAPNPDLTVTAVSWTPASPNETSAITLSATVRNGGTATAGATTVNFNLGGAVVGNAAVGSLAASATATVTLAVGQRPMGNYSVSATVDPTNTIIEQSDSNNTFTAASPLVVAQAPGPDLQVLSISANPPNPAAGASRQLQRGGEQPRHDRVRRDVGDPGDGGQHHAQRQHRLRRRRCDRQCGHHRHVDRDGRWGEHHRDGRRDQRGHRDQRDQQRVLTGHRGRSGRVGAVHLVRGGGGHLPGHAPGRPTRCARSGTPTSAPSRRVGSRCGSTAPASSSSSPRRTRRTRSWCATRSQTPPAAAVRTTRSASTSTARSRRS